MAGEVTSNIDDVGDRLTALVASFDFTVVGKDQSLGRDLSSAVAQGIQNRSTIGKAPDGSEWPANEEKYAKRKLKRYTADRPNRLTGQMISLESLKGKTTVSGDQVEMVYGTGEAATRATSGSADARDMIATDTEKAEWTTKGASGPERPFYELDDEIADVCMVVAAEVLDEYLKDNF